ncbi:male-specific lethal 1 homolog [Rhinatrema bivittatum]|uniref:male-specific lethal 1 homolog n=1 Tax=Rhinatrema bivittatum TaxID=194408 RepID=UPI00112927A0|nr:male-specific lethal 1 homolog [Rhinatrema bivittatum]
MSMRSTAFKALRLELEPAREQQQPPPPQQQPEVELEDGPGLQGGPEDGQATAASARKPMRRRLKEGREGWGGLLPLPDPDIFGRIGSQAGALAAKESAGGGAAAVVTGAGAATTAATGQQGLESLQVTAEGKWKQVRKSPGGGGGGGGGAGSQAVCLKQIVLLQLDLIEQQQQQLQAKEKEIGELQAERDTLLARIERMERRMQLVKKDSVKEKHRKCQGYEAEDKDEAEIPQKGLNACLPASLEMHQVPTSKPPSCGRSGKGHKRKSMGGNSERKTPVKKLAAEFSKLKAKTPKHSPVKDEPCDSLPETVCRRELRSKETPEGTRSQVDTQLKSATPLKGQSTLPKDKEYTSEAEELPYLATTEMYLCCWHEPPPSPLREPSPKKEESVAIPSWREQPVEPLRDINLSDVPENLEDSVFFKRHSKLELDEKRRKRWDIQRIREQRILQRLQLRMYKKKGIQESEPEITSFFPEPDDVESLVITPFLPVVAFGRPLPKLTPQNFELPWLDERSRCRLEMQKKQTPHRTCRK